MSRPAIPTAMKRAIEEEAGYRCAIPTCRDKGPFDFEHIDEWSKVKKHEFHNIVLLCVSCHARVTRNEIHKNAIRNYKRNLAIINGRYSLYEMRIIERIIEHQKSEGDMVLLLATESDFIHLQGLINDGVVSAKKIEMGGPFQDVFYEAIDVFRAMGVSDDAARSGAAQMLNIPQWYIMTTDEGNAFAKNYYVGNVLE